MTRTVTIVCLLLATVSSASVAARDSDSKSKVEPSKTAVSGAKADYILQPADLVRVEIFQEEDLKREVRISQEFTITLPLIDTIDLRGKSARQAESLIRDLYARDFLVKPQVNLFVLEYAPRRVYVAGAVTTPGEVLFQQEQGLSLIAAISRAGSFNRLADQKRVTLKRTLPDGSSETKTINVEELMKGENNETYPLQPGDVINVKERIL